MRKRREKTRGHRRARRNVSVARVAALALLVSGGLGGCGKSATPSDPSAATSGSTSLLAKGEQVYQQNCAVCHMADGSGVPNMQPALIGSAVIAGDPLRLETVIRGGSAAMNDTTRETANQMPPFGALPQDEMQALLAFLRQKFGDAGGTNVSSASRAP